MTTTVLTIAAGVVGGAIGNLAAMRHPWFGVWWYGFGAIACTVAAALEAVQRQWGWAAFMAFMALANAYWWDQCRRRRKRKRAAALAGAKSRARIARLVRRARQAARRRPVPQPVPGGTR